MLTTLSEIIEIKNGKNQKAVETENGPYPIYGSGGVIGRSTEYICPPNTVVIGRKGSINNPLFVEEPFWNVDTAFGLVANEDCLLPKYLYYFCKHFDFERLNTTVTIPSLTKANINRIEINLPGLASQKRTVEVLDKTCHLIDRYNYELGYLDKLIKSRFIEMFGNPVSNEKGFPIKLGKEIFKLSNGRFVAEERRLNTGIPVYGGNGVSWYTDDYLMENATLVVGRVGFQSGNVRYAHGPLWVSDNAMYISKLLDDDYDLHFLYYLMDLIDFTRFQDAGDLKKITQKPFMELGFICPPKQNQQRFLSIVDQIDKSKSVIQKSLDEAQLLFDSLMQEYFG